MCTLSTPLYIILPHKRIAERIKNGLFRRWLEYGFWYVGIPILFVLLVFYFLKKNNKRKEGLCSAQDILDKRYANGEIDTQEYEEKSNVLKKK